jgi:hypothetical protein
MKVIMRAPVKVVPGKMAQYMELEEKRRPMATRYGMPPERVYRLISGEGDISHTLVYEYEWDSLAALAAFYEKRSTDPEMQALQAQYDALIESHGLELYTPMP